MKWLTAYAGVQLKIFIKRSNNRMHLKIEDCPLYPMLFMIFVFLNIPLWVRNFFKWYRELNKSFELIRKPIQTCLPTFWSTLRFIRKGSSICPNPFKGFTLRSEGFEGLKGVGDQTTATQAHWKYVPLHTFLQHRMYRTSCFAAVSKWNVQRVVLKHV